MPDTPYIDNTVSYFVNCQAATPPVTLCNL